MQFLLGFDNVVLGDTFMEVCVSSGCVGVIGHSFGNTPD